jgi:hypothetical protein
MPYKNAEVFLIVSEYEQHVRPTTNLTVAKQNIRYLLSYIYLGSSVCLSSCHIPVVLSYSCHICGTLSYSLCFSNQTDQGNETEGFEREGLEMER